MLTDWHARGRPLMALLTSRDSSAKLKSIAAEHQAMLRDFWHMLLSLMAELAQDDDERLTLARCLRQHIEALEGLLPGSRPVGPAPGPGATFAHLLEWVRTLAVPSSADPLLVTLRTLDTFIHGNVASCFGSASAKAMLEFG